MKRLNFKLIGLTQLAIILVAGGLYLIHYWQVRSITSGILDDVQSRLDVAEDANEKDRELKEAYKSLRDYVALRPDDIKGWELLAKSLDLRQGASRRTLNAYEQLLRRASNADPERRNTWRRRLVEVAIELARQGDVACFAVAKDHLKNFRLLEAYPKDGALRYDLGLCQEYARTFTDKGDELGAVHCYSDAIELEPDRVDSYVRLAHVYRKELGNNSDANKVIDELGRIDTFEAHVRRSQYFYITRGDDPKNLDKAANTAMKAIELAPTETIDAKLDPFLLLADIVRIRSEQLADRVQSVPPAEPQGKESPEPLAETAYKTIRSVLEPPSQSQAGSGNEAAVQPRQTKNPAVYLALAALARERKDDDATKTALAWLDEGIKQAAPGNAAAKHDDRYSDLIWTRVDILISTGLPEDRKEAEKQIGELEAGPRRDYLTARIEANNGNWSEAAKNLEAARAQLQDRPELARRADLILAQCYGESAEPLRQLEAYRRVVSAEPTDVTSRLGMSGCLASLGRLDEAITECEQALQLQGEHPSLRTVAQLVRLRKMRVLQGPVADRDWSVVTQLVRRRLGEPPANEETPDSASGAPADSVSSAKALVAAEALALTKETAGDAVKWLIAARNNDDRGDVAAALARVYLRQGALEDSKKTLLDAQQRLGDQVELRLGWADYWSAKILRPQQADQQPGTASQEPSRGEDPQAELAKLASNVDAFDSTDQLRLLRGLAGVYERLNLPERARDLWQKVTQGSASDLSANFEIFQIDRESWRQADYASKERRLQLDKDIEEIDRIEKRSGASEKPYGPFGRYARAALELDAALAPGSSLADKQLDAAIASVDKALKVLPGRADFERLKADLLAAQKNDDAALESYEQAIKLGERDLRALGATAMILYRKGRFSEGLRVLGHVNESAVGLPLARLWSSSYIGVGNAAEVPGQWLPEFEKSQSPRDHVILGLVYTARDEKKHAEQAFNRAIELARQQFQASPESNRANAADEYCRAWVTYIAHLAETQQFVEAKEQLGQAEKELPSPEASTYLAGCWGLLHQEEDAATQQERLLKDAVAKSPDDAGIRKNIALFYLSKGREADAEPHLRKMLKLSSTDPKDVAWARRGLALVVGQSGRREDVEKALAQIEENLPEGVRKRLDKAIESVEGTSSRQQVPIQILEGMLSENGAGPSDLRKTVHEAIGQNPELAVDFRALALLRAANIYSRLSLGDDRFLLAQLYRFSGQRAKALDAALSVVASGEKDPHYPDYIAFLIGAYVEGGQLNDAGLWIAIYEQWLNTQEKATGEPALAVDAATRERWQFVLVSLKVRLLVAQKKPDEGIALVNAYVTGSDGSDLPLRRAAVLLDELRQPAAAAAAEKLWRRLWDQSKDPDVALSLALNLASQRRFDDALDVCEQVRQDCTPHLLASAVVEILRHHPKAKDQFQRVDPWFDAAMRNGKADSPDFLKLLTAMTALRDLQGRYAEAQALYEEILKLDPDNVVALNNLAWLLAYTPSGNRDEALKLIERAIELRGPNPALLDTRGTIHLRKGDTAKALEDLKLASANAPTAAILFHLAQAYASAGKGSEAKDAMQRANDASARMMEQGLSPGVPHPLELSQYQELAARFQGK